MPHKKNPDIFELIRAKTNRIQSLPTQMAMLCANLTSGYFRDMQLSKEIYLPAFKELTDCLFMTEMVLKEIELNPLILQDKKYSYLFTVEEVNDRVAAGIPFRAAYRMVAEKVQLGEYRGDTSRPLHHTHEGSIGNLCNDAISALMQQVIDGFNFCGMEKAEKALLGR